MFWTKVKLRKVLPGLVPTWMQKLGVARKGRPNPFTPTGQLPAGEKLDHAHAAKVELDAMSNLYSSETVLRVKP